MKTVYLPVIAFAAILGTACGQHGHKRAAKEIQKERIEKSQETADINEAVKATDAISWDSLAAYRSFRDSCRPRLDKNRQRLNEFEKEVSKGGRTKVPVYYQVRIQKLEDRNTALEQKLTNHPFVKGQEDWEDFSRLYTFDLQRLERDIQKLTKKQ